MVQQGSYPSIHIQGSSSYENSDGEFRCAVFVFRMKFLRLMRKAIKLLLTELVARLVGQCRNILPLAFTSLTSLRSVNKEKAVGNTFLN